jgi:hypothetical protein
MHRSLAGALACLAAVVLLAPPARADAPAATITPNPWTAPAKAQAVIGACLKGPKNDDESLAKPCTDRYVAACEKADNDTTVAMVECGSEAVAYWTAVVKTRTHVLLARHDATLSSYVQKSDPIWRSYLKSRCGMYQLFTGTIWGPTGVDCALAITLARADDLDTLRQNYFPVGAP